MIVASHFSQAIFLNYKMTVLERFRGSQPVLKSVIRICWPRNGLDQRKPAEVSPGVSTREEARRQCGTIEKAQVLEANHLHASSAWDTGPWGSQ